MTNTMWTNVVYGPFKGLYSEDFSSADALKEYRQNAILDMMSNPNINLANRRTWQANGCKIERLYFSNGTTLYLRYGK